MVLARTTLTAGGLQFGALTAGRGDSFVLCLHGFPDTDRSFRAQLPALAAAGHHAVAPMMRGYEAISRPLDRRYDVLALADDVVGWMDSLGARRAHVVGHDWGAVVAQAAAVRHPDRVRSLVSVAIPPLRRLPEVLAARPGAALQLRYMLGFQLPGAVRRAAADDLAQLDALWRRWSPGWAPPASERSAVHEALRRPGVLDAALSYYRALFALWRPRSRRAIALLRREIAVPTLVLFGDRDGCFAPEIFPMAAARARFTGGVELRRVPDAGHFLHQERPEEVNSVLVRWLAAH